MRLSAVLVALAFGACRLEPGPVPPGPPQPPPEPTDAGTGDAVVEDAGAQDEAPDAGAGPFEGDRCERGFHRATYVLRCPLPAPRSGTWVEMCRNAESAGVDIEPDCLERAADCDAVHLCRAASPR